MNIVIYMNRLQKYSLKQRILLLMHFTHSTLNFLSHVQQAYYVKHILHSQLSAACFLAIATRCTYYTLNCLPHVLSSVPCQCCILYTPTTPLLDRSRNAVKTFGTSDLTNNLCSALEAVLIHGIKDSYSSRVSSFFTSDPDRMPVPNFWPVIMSVCHKDDIKEVECFSSLVVLESDVVYALSFYEYFQLFII